MTIPNAFSAMVLTQAENRTTSALRTLEPTDLPPGDVLVRIAYSGLNYKDGMVLKGLGRLVRTYPHVPGIDFVGTVVHSEHPAYKDGDEVILTGWRVGESHWGGYSQMARIKGDWLVPKPQGLSAEQAMAVGTAGFTAMLAVMALEEHGVTPESGEVLVTGAAGGLGSIATAILANLGYSVSASTGREELGDYLRSLGASAIVPRGEIAGPPAKPLDSERWAGAVDSVGGTTLATVLTRMRYRSSVAACGLAGGSGLETTVVPFLLRGVNLLGIDSVMSPIEERRAAWTRLSHDLPKDKLSSITSIVPLSAVAEYADRILAGQVKGRIVVDVNA